MQTSRKNNGLDDKVTNFIQTPRMINRKMRDVITHRDTEMQFDEILNYCLRKGWSDAVIRERYNGTSTIISNKDTIIAFLKSEITNLRFNENFDCWHDSLCSSTCCGMRYGVWQKFINMTFKYLYCFKDVPAVSNVSLPWDSFHCPIDSVIALKILDLIDRYNIDDVEGKRIITSIANNGLHELNASWNNIDSTKYTRVQSIIEKICRREKISSKLNFDFIHWERI